MCAVAETDVRVAIQFLAENLAAYQCKRCRWGDAHDVCDQPDWASIGKQMREFLNG